MNLSSWSSLSENARREWILERHKNGQSDEYLDLAEEAAKVLKAELRSNADVTNVRLGVGEPILVEPPLTFVCERVLNVCTLLPEHNTIETLPGDFFGFRVVQLNLGDKRDAFLKTLTRVLKELKGWTEADTLRWADQVRPEPLNESLSGGFLFTPLYSHGPLKLAVYALIEEVHKESPKTLGREYITLRNDILSIMRDAARRAGAVECEHLDTLQNFDWSSVRTKIKDLIERWVMNPPPPNQ